MLPEYAAAKRSVALLCGETLMGIQLQIIIRYKTSYPLWNRAYAAFVNNPVNQFNIPTCDCSIQQVTVSLQYIRQYSGYTKQISYK